MSRKALLLNGSPRDGATTSGSLGEYLMGKLKAEGIETGSYVISRSLENEDLYNEMMRDLASSEIIVLSYPLYIDSPPSDVIRWMELTRDAEMVNLEGVSFLAIGNSDDPDPKRLDVAMSMLHNFSDSMGMKWSGGLRMPMGPIIDGVPLDGTGGRGKNARKALELTATAISCGEVVPEEALMTMSIPPMSELFYIMRTNRAWKKKAIINGVRMDLFNRPSLK